MNSRQKQFSLTGVSLNKANSYQFVLLSIFVLLIMASAGYGQTTNKYFVSGESKLKANDYTGAIADFTKAIEIDPKDSESYLLRAVPKLQLKDFIGAMADCNKAIEINLNDPRSYAARAVVKSCLQDHRGAIYDLTKSIKSQPDAYKYSSRGRSKSEIQDYDGALLDYTKAIELDPKYAEAYFNRGTTKLKLGQKDSGLMDLSKAGELGYEEAYEAIKNNANTQPSNVGQISGSKANIILPIIIVLMSVGLIMFYSIIHLLVINYRRGWKYMTNYEKVISIIGTVGVLILIARAFIDGMIRSMD